MEIIDTFLRQNLGRMINWIIDAWWYWVPAGVGFLFRFGLLKYKIYDPEKRIKTILRDIGIIFTLTVGWTWMDAGECEDDVAIMISALTMIYIFYGFVEQCEETGGKTESILLILKSVLVTMLSFQTILATIFGATITCLLAVLAYKFWLSNEKKTDLFEIIFLCIESIILSIYGTITGIGGIGVFLFVFYEETAIFLLNYIAKYIASLFFREEEYY